MAAATLVVALVIMPDQATADDLFILQRDLDCLVKYAETYLAVEKDPQLVFLALCPNAAPSSQEIQEAHTVNSLPKIKQTKSGTKVTSILVLSHAHITCLKERGDRVAQPAQEAAGDPNEAIVRIDLTMCNEQ